ncbi:MAG: ABC transporter permease [Gammaproteobacteria bacterium]|nr:MAG: ABC transporter permease [Gammaproteobacteria bacterium]
MRPVDTARLAFQSIHRYPLRTTMLLLAVSIGVAAVVLLTGVGEGARRYVTGEFAALGTHLIVVLPGKAETAGAGGTGTIIGATARDLTLEDAMAIERSAHIAQVAPIIVGSGNASWRAREREITVLGTTTEMLDVQHWTMQLGRFLPDIDMDIATPVCVMGSVVRDEFFDNTNPLGQWLRIGDTRCRVIGVLTQGGITGPFDTDELVILPIASAQQLFNAPGVFRILTEAVSQDSMDAARRDIIEIIKARHQGEEDITVVTQDAVLATFESIFDMITMGLAGIAAISLVVAGVLIMNVMLVAVSQRTKEIGLLKALGAKERHIVALFLAEAVFLSLFGALLGLILGNAGTRLLGTVFPILDFSAPTWAMVAAVGVAVTSGLLFSILPARRAARLDAVLALAGR